MPKTQLKPGTMLYPVPAVMVSCTDGKGNNNIITIAWTGILCSEPPMVYISIRPERYSYEMIKNTKEFVINLPNKKLCEALDFCGVKSGRDVNKFEYLGLTCEKSNYVATPSIAEAPLSLECKVRKIISLGSHDVFISEIVGVSVDEKLIDEKGKLDLSKADLICYNKGEYWSLKESLGFYGYSIK
ncbi:MAG: flavin reductase family protein [Clostridiales bacterium]|nr:flavin reductase family protein [Clostridiales bacterium]